MKNLIIILYLLISNLLAQIIPIDLINKVDTNNIPEYIPSINTGESNILFNLYSGGIVCSCFMVIIAFYYIGAFLNCCFVSLWKRRYSFFIRERKIF